MSCFLCDKEIEKENYIGINVAGLFTVDCHSQCAMKKEMWQPKLEKLVKDIIAGNISLSLNIGNIKISLGNKNESQK